MQTLDRPNAFVQTHLEDEDDMVIVHLCGALADALIAIDPETYELYAYRSMSGETILLIMILNALYGIMQAALLFYEKNCPRYHEHQF